MKNKGVRVETAQEWEKETVRLLENRADSIKSI